MSDIELISELRRIFQHYDKDDFCDRVNLEQFPDAPLYIKGIMQKCLRMREEERPTFREICSMCEQNEKLAQENKN